MAWSSGLMGSIQNIKYWIAVSAETSVSTVRVISTAIDNNKNVYNLRGSDGLLHLTKFSPNGEVLDELSLDSVSAQYYPHSLAAVDGSIYATLGDTYGSSGFPSSVIKVDGSTLNRDYHMSLDSNFIGSPADTFSVPSEPNYVYHSARSGTNTFSIGIAKVLKADGSFAWKKSATTPESYAPNSAGVYSSLSSSIVLLGGDRGTTPLGDSEYMGGMVSIAPSDGSFIKYKRFLIDASSAANDYTRVWAADTGSDGYIYAVGNTTAVDGVQKAFMVKIDPSSDSIVWTRLFSNVTFNGTVDAEMTCTTDHNNNTYLVMHSTYPRITKVDSNGNIVWSRKINTETSPLYPTSPNSIRRPIRVDCDKSSLYLTIEAWNDSAAPYPSKTVVMKLPSNGGLTGSYSINGVNIDYAVDSDISISSVTSAVVIDLPEVNNFSWNDSTAVDTPYAFTDSALNSSFVSEEL